MQSQVKPRTKPYICLKHDIAFIISFQIWHCVCRYVHVSAVVHRGQKRAVHPTGARFTGGYELPESWQLNSDSLQEHQMP